MTSHSNGGAPWAALFAALFAGCDGLVELRALPSKARCFAAAGDYARLARFINAGAHQNFYMGVASRRDASSGDLANCQHLGALYADVDFKHTPEAEARARLARGPLPPSAIVHSGGGLHVYWLLREPLTLPEEAERVKQLLRRVAEALGGDLAAAEAARVLRVPGTKNYKPDYPTPRPVRLEQLEPTRRYNPSELDEWLPALPAAGTPERRAPFTMPERIREGERNATLYRLARSLHARGLGLAAVLAALERENAEKCEPPLLAGEIADIAQHAMTQPDTPAFAAAVAELDADHATDMANAGRFAREHATDVRYCFEWKAWLVWDGTRWARDPGPAVMARAKATANGRWAEATALPAGEARKRAVRFAEYSESARGLRAMLELARTEAGIPILPAAFDADPWVLNTPSGTVDLRTGARRSWRREDYCSRLTAAPFEPGAAHPMLARFLEMMLPDPAVRAYVQRALGYSITGSTGAEVVFLGHGPTAGGKTTLLESVKAAVGDYALAADFETFRPRKHEAAPREDLVRLWHARLVVVAETRAQRLDAAVIKRMSGGDTTVGRQLYRGSEEARPVSKVWMAGNVRPVVDADDDAVFRRLREVPFPRSLTAAERDPAVKATLTDPAVGGPAVLAWLVAGCLAWQAEGLAEPPGIVGATAAYQAAMNDGLGEFVAEQMIAEPGAWVSRETLREALTTWLHTEGVTRTSDSKAVAAAVRRIGAADRKRHGVRGWAGVRLRVAADPEPEPVAQAAVSPW